MKENDNSKMEQLMDLLLDALQERQAARGGDEGHVTPVEPPVRERVVYEAPVEALVEAPVEAPAEAVISAVYPDDPDEIEMETAEEELIPSPYIPEELPTIHLDQMLARLVVIIFAITVIMNIPFNRYGTNLARAMPDAQSLVIRDGLVLKGSGEEIYVLEDNHKRWISSLDAFGYYGYRWQQVNIVNDSFLNQFPDGPALSVLQKCPTSPHVFAIENGVKRWIKDIATFEAQGYVWEDVQGVSCTSLRAIPDGPPIPEDAGEPPVP